ncbi:MAG: hypothetical protein JSS66_06355 [Armatimonadetes bacterium]|nr:hypothetical protein [Armatimonadota bacterium]
MDFVTDNWSGQATFLKANEPVFECPAHFRARDYEPGNEPLHMYDTVTMWADFEMQGGKAELTLKFAQSDTIRLHNDTCAMALKHRFIEASDGHSLCAKFTGDIVEWKELSALDRYLTADTAEDSKP